jgi:hypothetical protein
MRSAHRFINCNAPIAKLEARQMKRRLLEASLVLISLVVGYLFVEGAYRAWLYFSVVAGNYAVFTIDHDMRDRGFGRPGSIFGPYPTLATVTYSSYKFDGGLARQHLVRFNNLGWVSQNDYSRLKASGEYRIAILGDFLTASVNNEKPWPDVLQHILDADNLFKNHIRAERVTVLNLGVAGASMQLMANPLAIIARRFSADLVVTNFVIEDLARRHSDEFERIQAEPAGPLNDAPAELNPIGNREIEIEGVRIRSYCASDDEKSCIVSPLWEVAPSRTLAPKEINALKKQAAQRLFSERTLYSLRPLALQAVFHWISVPPVKAQALPVIMQSGREPEDIDIGVRVLHVIERLHPGSLRTLNPLLWYFDRTSRPAIIDRFLPTAAEGGLPVVDMAEWLPIQLGDAERRRWYNLPHDFHWSDHGAEVYARGMADLIREHLMSRGGATIEGAGCASAFAQFRDAEAASRSNKPVAALVAVKAGRAALPADAELRVREPVAFRDCGFIERLYALEARALSALGRHEAADAARARSLAFTSDRSALDRPSAGGDDQ